jgi:hypothetical protein
VRSHRPLLVGRLNGGALNSRAIRR